MQWTGGPSVRMESEGARQCDMVAGNPRSLELRMEWHVMTLKEWDYWQILGQWWGLTMMVGPGWAYPIRREIPFLLHVAWMFGMVLQGQQLIVGHHG